MYAWQAAECAISNISGGRGGAGVVCGGGGTEGWEGDISRKVRESVVAGERGGGRITSDIAK